MITANFMRSQRSHLPSRQASRRDRNGDQESLRDGRAIGDLQVRSPRGHGALLSCLGLMRTARAGLPPR